mgnify:CR=1 FL=1
MPVKKGLKCSYTSGLFYTFARQNGQESPRPSENQLDTYHTMKKTSPIPEALKALGIGQLNPMQEAAIDAWKEGKNLVLLSPTGSGKTLAYLLPLELRYRKIGFGLMLLFGAVAT